MSTSGQNEASNDSVAPPPPPPPCNVCDNYGDGPVACESGSPIVYDDIPTAGGPWALVFYPGGGHSWYNVGGMLANAGPDDLVPGKKKGA